MRITCALLKQHNACKPQRDRFRELYPDGCEPTVEVLFDLAAETYTVDGYENNLDPWWLWHVLPDEGPGSKRAYALWCAEQVAHLNGDPRVAQCLAVVRRRVEDPASVSENELAAAWAAAGAAAGDAAWAAARAAARAAAWAAAGDAAWAAAWAAARAAARAAAWAAAGSAAGSAAWAAARAAAGDAAGDAAWAAAGAAAFMDSALACLADMLERLPGEG